ncbi:tetratricopeptide repeat protein, partial [Elusimicrobiota bacterium]
DAGPKDLNAGDWLELAQLMRATGRKETARLILERVREAGPGPGDAAVAARVYAELGETAPIPALIRPLIEGATSALSCEHWLDVSYAAVASKERGAALQALDRARGLGPGSGEKRRMARYLQDLKEYERALRVLDGLAVERPGDAGLLADRGVLKALMGRREAAVADLRAAIESDAGLLGAYVTLGGLLGSSGKGEEALRLYDRVLAEEKRFRGRPELGIVRRERERLLFEGTTGSPE